MQIDNKLVHSASVSVSELWTLKPLAIHRLSQRNYIGNDGELEMHGTKRWYGLPVKEYYPSKYTSIVYG
jgi:hypothetical protein